MCSTDWAVLHATPKRSAEGVSQRGMCMLSHGKDMLISLAAPQLPICCVINVHQAQLLQVMSSSLIAVTTSLDPEEALTKGTKRLDPCTDCNSTIPGTGAPFKPPYQKAKNAEPEEGEVSAKSLEMLAGKDLTTPQMSVMHHGGTAYHKPKDSSCSSSCAPALLSHWLCQMCSICLLHKSEPASRGA